ncbi:MAG: imidazolonepropionase [Gammaproteobacteria bacterium]
MMNRNNQIDYLCVDAHLATFANEQPYGVIRDGAIAISGEEIIWVGKQNDLPKEFRTEAKQIYSAEGRWILPGLIDCHTHLIYGGNRAHEFEWRLNGKTYAEIALAGGGILSTVKATRAASATELLLQSEKRLKNLVAEGVTTIEIKSGYGLDLETEIKCLQVAKELEKKYPISVHTTYLGAHALSPEFKSKDDYIEYVCNDVLPEVARLKLANSVDGFCEKIAFSKEQIERVYQAAKALGFSLKLHAEQLTNAGGAKLAAEYQALSADHLEFVSEDGIKAMAENGTVAVLLPGAFYFLREKQLPPIELIQQYQVPIAIATDCNPGTSPICSLLLIANMACVLFRLTPEVALTGITKHAASALGLQSECGTLEINKKADLSIWDIKEPCELVYQIGLNKHVATFKNGKLI